MKQPKKIKCKHEWYGERYCRKCGETEMWGSITGNTALDLENKLIAGDLPKQKEIREKIEARIKKVGLKMAKKLSSGGLFSSPTYDNRTVYSLEELFKLSKQGFGLDEDAGIFLFNVFTSE